MNKKKSDFDKVFSAWDILVIAFGAMIGWGWVVSTGGWIEKGGVVGAALGFIGFSLLSEVQFFVVPKNGSSLNKQPPAMRVRVDCYTKKLPFDLQ